MKTCNTCNKQVTTDFLEFKCPGCGKAKIIRCLHCRTTSKDYKCGECGFTGP